MLSNYTSIMAMFSRMFLLLLLSNVVISQSIVKRLPGFPDNLPFRLETGYIGVGDLEELQLFYYFIESERCPTEDPLMLWLTGGPGCSGFSGLVYEIGPISFNYANSTGNKPTLVLNPYSWTKVANIIFLDAPVGTGFSYATTQEAYNGSDTIQASANYEFLQKWFLAHRNFLKNPLYISGDSYSGKIVPMVVQKIADGNEIGHNPPVNLQGYVLGNPVADLTNDLNSRVDFAHLKALISDKLYESAKRSCKGQYVFIDPSNGPCMNDLKVYSECVGKINTPQILEPTCPYFSPKPLKLGWDPSAFIEDSVDILASRILLPRLWCRGDNYLFSYIWLNDKTVRKVLHVREDTVENWVRCNHSLSYTQDVPSVVDLHRKLIKKGYQVLIYSGDHDMVIPYVGTLTWIQYLNLTKAYDWRPWFVDGQVAGYTMQYYHKKSHLTYATVKGGGHTAPEYKPKQCLAMLDRWFASYPL